MLLEATASCQPVETAIDMFSHATFWNRLRRALIARQPLLEAIREAGQASGMDLRIVTSLTTNLAEGSSFAAALARHPEFSNETWEWVSNAELQGRGMLHVVEELLRHFPDPGED